MIKNFTIIILLFVVSSNIYAYVLTKTLSGENVHWKKTGNIILYTDTVNSYGLSHNVVQTIINNSVASWNNNSGKKIVVDYSDGGITSVKSKLYFSNDSDFFSSSGIAAVTQLNYNEETGAIIKADIILNDGLTLTPFTNDTNDNHYLGNVISHELGHFLGLSHSEVFHSSMFYKLKRGQYKITSDERGGAIAQYGIFDSYDFFIEGRVVGGKPQVGIFGAKIEAISQRTGAVVASSLSDSNGFFKVMGLNNNDMYSLYVSPVKKIDVLPHHYQNIRNDFCNSSRSFRGSFFSSCYNSDKGHPQIIAGLNKSSVNIGNVLIRCSLDTPMGYLASKESEYELEMVKKEINEIQLGQSFVGYFTKHEALNNHTDMVKLKFNNYDMASELAGKTLYYHIKTVSQSLGSQIYLSLKATNSYSTYFLPTNLDSNGLKYDNKNNPRIEINEYIPLSLNDPEIKIEVMPKAPQILMSDLNNPTLFDEVFFGGADGMNHDDMLFYNMIIDVVEFVGGQYIPISSRYAKNIQDNSSCYDAYFAYSIAPGGTQGTQVGQEFAKRNSGEVNAKGADLLSCGTVAFDNEDDGGNGGAGPLGMGFLIVSCLCIFMFTKYIHLS